MNKQELIELLNTLKIEKEEFLVLSFSTLVSRNIYEYLEYLNSSSREKDIERILLVKKYINKF